MLGTLDDTRAEGAEWLERAQRAETPETPADPLTPWLRRVDLLLYAAAAGFVACVAVILVS
jgi:hypothetical protein